MRSYANMINNYTMYNRLANEEGTVIFGGSEDKDIDVNIIEKYFELDITLYNRSLNGLTVKDASSLYGLCVNGMKVNNVILHIGAEDIENFEKDSAQFDADYMELIRTVKTISPDASICAVSFKNPFHNTTVDAMNRHIRFIADSEQIEYGDITSERVWSAREARRLALFIQEMGFVRKEAGRRSNYDLLNMLYRNDDMAPDNYQVAPACSDTAGVHGFAAAFA